MPIKHKILSKLYFCVIYLSRRVISFSSASRHVGYSHCRVNIFKYRIRCSYLTNFLYFWLKNRVAKWDGMWCFADLLCASGSTQTLFCAPFPLTTAAHCCCLRMLQCVYYHVTLLLDKIVFVFGLELGLN